MTVEPENGEITEDDGPAIDPASLGPARIGSPFEPNRLGSILGGGRARALFGLAPNSSDGETPQVADDVEPTPELGDIPGLEDLDSAPAAIVDDADHTPSPEPDLDPAPRPAEEDDEIALGSHDGDGPASETVAADWPTEPDLATNGSEPDMPDEVAMVASEPLSPEADQVGIASVADWMIEAHLPEEPVDAVEAADEHGGADRLVEAHLPAEAETVVEEVASQTDAQAAPELNAAVAPESDAAVAPELDAAAAPELNAAVAPDSEAADAPELNAPELDAAVAPESDAPDLKAAVAPELDAAELSSEAEAEAVDESEWMIEPDVAPVTVEASADVAPVEAILDGESPLDDLSEDSRETEAEVDSDEVEISAEAEGSSPWETEADAEPITGASDTIDDETADQETEPVFEFFVGGVKVDATSAADVDPDADPNTHADTDIEVTSDDLVIMPSMEDLRAMAADLDDVDAILERLDSDEDSVLAEIELPDIELPDTESSDQALDLTPAE